MKRKEPPWNPLILGCHRTGGYEDQQLQGRLGKNGCRRTGSYEVTTPFRVKRVEGCRRTGGYEVVDRARRDAQLGCRRTGGYEEELANALDLGSSDASHGGSNPSARNTLSSRKRTWRNW